MPARSAPRYTLSPPAAGKLTLRPSRKTRVMRASCIRNEDGLDRLAGEDQLEAAQRLRERQHVRGERPEIDPAGMEQRARLRPGLPDPAPVDVDHARTLEQPESEIDWDRGGRR